MTRIAGISGIGFDQIPTTEALRKVDNKMIQYNYVVVEMLSASTPKNEIVEWLGSYSAAENAVRNLLRKYPTKRYGIGQMLATARLNDDPVHWTALDRTEKV